MGDLEKDLRKRQAAQALRMTKILLCLGLVAVTLLAFAGAENESQERRVAESFHPRAVRAGEPAAAARRRNNQRGRKNKQRKTKKNKVNKTKGKKNKKNRNRKNRKNQNKKRKDKKNNKSKKQQKNKNKNRKRQKTEKERKQKATRTQESRQTDSNCLSETCVDNAVKYHKLVNEKVRNFEAQKKRAERFRKQLGNKGAKNADFDHVIDKLVKAGGGNASNLTCNGKNNKGSELLMNLTAELGMCNMSIQDACTVEPVPASNQTFLEACAKTMDDFTTKVEEATRVSSTETVAGSESCALWDHANMTILTDSMKGCITLLQEEGNLAKATNRACKKQFTDCRGKMEDLGNAIAGCSPANSEDKVKAAIEAGKANKEAAEMVGKKIDEELMKNATTRAQLNCSDFADQVSTVFIKLEHQPLLATLLADMNSLANATVAACDSAAQSKLTSSKDELALALTAIGHALEHKAELLLQSTGEVYDIGTSNTTSNVTAPAPSPAATTVAAIEITVAGTTVAAPMTTASSLAAPTTLAPTGNTDAATPGPTMAAGTTAAAAMTSAGAATAGATTLAATAGATTLAATAGPTTVVAATMGSTPVAATATATASAAAGTTAAATTIAATTV